MSSGLEVLSEYGDPFVIGGMTFAHECLQGYQGASLRHAGNQRTIQCPLNLGNSRLSHRNSEDLSRLTPVESRHQDHAACGISNFHFAVLGKWHLDPFVSGGTEYFTLYRSYLLCRGHLPSLSDEPEAVETLRFDEIEVR